MTILDLDVDTRNSQIHRPISLDSKPQLTVFLRKLSLKGNLLRDTKRLLP